MHSRSMASPSIGIWVRNDRVKGIGIGKTIQLFFGPYSNKCNLLFLQQRTLKAKMGK